jgi:hypothetical protein
VLAATQSSGGLPGEPPLPTATVVIGGDLLEPGLLAESAQRNFDVYGFDGVSVFANLRAR